VKVQTPRHRLPARAVALVLAGGRGSRLKALTDTRAKPAVYFGAKYRIVDFALSNCVNSGLRRIYVLTQYKSHSLLRHIQRGWNLLNGEMNEFIDLLPASQRVNEEMWYRGTADAVWQNLDILRAEGPEYILILAGDHVYKMDYGRMLAEHVQRGADVTVGCVEVPRDEATAFGVMDIDADERIVNFLEKPQNPPAIPGRPDRALASMGIYVFTAELLYDLLSRDADDPRSSHDFGKDFIPSLVSRAKVLAHPFGRSCVSSDPDSEAYWRDVGTLDAYWEANLDLTAVTPALDLYDLNWPIHSHQPPLPPAKFVFDGDTRRGYSVDSICSGGVVVSGAAVRRSVLSSQVRVNSWARIEDSVLLPECVVGRHARLRKVILDRGCVIPEGLVVGEDPVEDARRFHVSEGGVVLVTQQMLSAL
jgi:glucose-1-phosphate adenylyltransferase